MIRDMISVSLVVSPLAVSTACINLHLFHFMYRCLSCTHRPNSFLYLQCSHDTLSKQYYTHITDTDSK